MWRAGRFLGFRSGLHDPRRKQLPGRWIWTDAGMEELEATVSADHAKAWQEFRTGSLNRSVELEYARNGSIRGLSYKQNQKDVQLLVGEILKSRDAASVMQILQNWLKQVAARSVRSNFGPAAVSYEDAVSVASDLVREFGQRGSEQITIQVLEWMQYQDWFHLDPALRIHLIDVLGKSSSFDIAIKVFDQFIKVSVKKDVRLYNALLHTFCQAGRYEAVDQLFKDMKQSSKPDRLSYIILMHSYVKAGEDLAKVARVFKEMYLQRMKWDIVSYDILINGCVNGKHAKEARVFFENLKKQGLTPNVITYTTLMNVYVASGNCAAALEVLQEMVESGCRPNVFTFSCLIYGYATEGNKEQALKVFDTMKRLGVKPNQITFNILMSMYSREGNLERAQAFFHEMIESGLEPTFVSFLSLMYCFKSAGAYKEVVGIYEDVKGKGSLCNIYIYTEVLDACIKWGNWSKVEDTLSDIVAADCYPTMVTCTVVLMALGSDCKRAEEASMLINFLRQFDSKLFLIVRLFILEVLDDDQMRALLVELGKLLSLEKPKTSAMFSAGLMDALWTLGWCRRAATVMMWFLHKGYRECACSIKRQEWMLDVRRTSIGCAVVSFYMWLNWLEQGARAIQESEADQRAIEDSNIQELDSGEQSIRDSNAQKSESDEQRHALEGRVLSLEKLVGDSVFPKFSRLPCFLRVMSGTGLIKQALEKEILRLGIPFRYESTGCWTSDGETLKTWLLDTSGGHKLLLTDSAAD